jgi:ubiquinone/menaquinone biosynthesis C-methylase UbiE
LADDDPSRARRTDSPAHGSTNVAQYFGRIAQSYGDGEYYLRRQAAVVRAIANEIAKARRVLDLGCGNGRYLYEFRKTAPDATLIGADLTAEMVAESRRRNGVGMPLLRADATAVPFRDATLDVIFISHVLQFVSDKDATMRGLVRCLARGGAVIVTVGGAGIRESLRGIVSDEQWNQLARAAFPGRGRTATREGEQLHREAMSRAGLAIETRDAPFSVTWAGVVEWIDLRWAPFMDEAQRHTTKRILDEMTPTLSARSFDVTQRLLIGRKAR